MKIKWYLLIIIFLMIFCFFSWSENISLTRSIKLIGRMIALLASYWVYLKIIRYGALDSLKWHNTLSLLLYIVYLILGLASFMWSTNVAYSALQWFMVSQTLIFSYFFIKSIYLLDFYFSDNYIKLYNLFGSVSFSFILIFVIGMWVAPDIFIRLTHGGAESRLGGYIINPNELGLLACIGVALLIFDLYRNHFKWWTLLKLVILLYALYCIGSRSSLISLLLIIIFHVNLLQNIKLKILIIISLIFVTPLATNKIVLKDGDPIRLQEVTTMTGRLPFWKALVYEGLPREPLLGFGFMRIDYKEYFQSSHTYPGKMAHNTFIQVLMNLGFIGLIVVIFQIIFTLKGVLEEDKEKKLVLLSMLIPLLINSITEFGIYGESNYGVLFYQCVIFYISFKNNPFITFKEKNNLLNKK